MNAAIGNIWASMLSLISPHVILLIFGIIIFVNLGAGATAEKEKVRRPKTEMEGKQTASFGEDERLNEKVDDFINRFNQQKKLQRYEEMLTIESGRGSKTDHGHHLTRSKSDTVCEGEGHVPFVRFGFQYPLCMAEKEEVRRPTTEREGKQTASFGEDERLNEKVADFINRFNQQMKLQRYEEMLTIESGRGSKTDHGHHLTRSKSDTACEGEGHVHLVKVKSLQRPYTFETLPMDLENQGKIDDLSRFVGDKEFYKSIDRAWKRGYLLYEPPGTDRSSLIVAMADYLKFEIYHLDIRSMSSILELTNMLVSTRNRSLIAIKDFDHCAGMLPNLKNEGLYKTSGSDYRNESSVETTMELTGSSLLKFLDVLLSSCGGEKIIVLTTNHRDLYDAALLHPFNMDIHIHTSSPQPIAVPDGGEIVELDSSEQKPLPDFDATINSTYQSGLLVSNSENKNTIEESKRRCMTENVPSLVDSTTRRSSTDFDALDNRAHLVMAHQTSPIISFDSEEKDTREGVYGECLTKSVLSFDDSTKRKSLPDFVASENKAHLVRAYQSGPIVSFSDNKSRGESVKEECIAKSILDLEDLRQHSGGRRDATEKSFGSNLLGDATSFRNYEPPMVCFCGENAPMRTSNTRANPGRKYYSCEKKFKRGESCGFFVWYDNPQIGREMRQNSGAGSRQMRQTFGPYSEEMGNNSGMQGLEMLASKIEDMEEKINLRLKNHEGERPIYDQGFHATDDISWKSFDLPPREQPNDCLPLSTLGRLRLEGCVQPEKSPDLPRVAQINGVEQRVTKSPRYLGGLTAQSISSSQVVLNPLEQSTKNVAHVARPDQCSPTVPLPEKKMVRRTLKRKCRTMSVMFEIHQQHFVKRYEGTAKSFRATRICRKHGINRVSTVKRIHKQHGIHQWPFRQKWATRREYSLEEKRPFEASSLSMDEKLVSRFLFIPRSSPWPLALTDGSEIVGPIALLKEFAARKNRAHLVRQNQSDSIASHYERKNTRETSGRQGIAKSTSSIEDLQPHFGCKHEDAVKRRGVKVSIFKSSCRPHLVYWLPCQIKKNDSLAWKSFEVLESLPLGEQSISRHFAQRRTLTHKHCVRRKKSQELPRSLQIDCSGGLGGQSAVSLPDGGYILSLSEKKIVGKTLKRKCRTMSVFSLEDHRQHGVRRWEDAAKSLGRKCICRQLVIQDVSKAKRIRRQHVINQWPFQQNWATIKAYSVGDKRPAEVISLATDGKLVSRLQLIHISWLGEFLPRPSALPGGETAGPIALLSSDAATNNRAHITRNNQSGSSASHSEKKRPGEPEDLEGTNRSISLEDLAQLFDMKREDAAKILDVSVSKLKRICRQHGIERWPYRVTNKAVKKPPDQHRGMNTTGSSDDWRNLSASQEEPLLRGHVSGPIYRTISSCTDPAPGQPTPIVPHTTRNLLASEEEVLLWGHVSGPIYRTISSCTEPAPSQPMPIGPHPTEDLEDQRNLLALSEEPLLSQITPTIPPTMDGFADWSAVSALFDNSFPEGHASGSIDCTVPASSNPAPSQPMPSSATERQNMDFVELKATYGDTTIKFQLPPMFETSELKEKVSKILECELGSFKVEYKDKDGEWILMGCDENVREYLQLLNSLGKQVMKLKISDKVPNTTNLCETCGSSLTRKRPRHVQM